MSKYVKKKNHDLYSGYGLNCVPQNPYVEVLTPVPQDVTVFGDGVFKAVIKLKWAC